MQNQGLPWWLNGKESTCSAGAAGDSGSIPGLGRSPGEGNGNPLQYSYLENSMDRSVAGYSPWGCRLLDMTEATEHSLTIWLSSVKCLFETFAH